MRADRLLSILMLLQVEARITARELAERLEVSERTIYRDMEALTTAGVPVAAERGSGGGWFLLEPYRTDLTGLNTAEIRTLFLTRPIHLLEGLGLGGASEGALIKLLAALPSQARRQAERVRERIHIDGTSWHPRAEELPTFPLLQEAVWSDRRLKFVYARQDGTATELTGDPLGLVAKGSVWYLVAGNGGEPRTYRVARIREAELLHEAAVRPEGFDLAGYWREATARFKATLPCYEVRARVAPDGLGRLRRRCRRLAAHDPDPDGWIPLTLHFDVEEEACELLLGYGASLEVLQPLALIDRLMRRASEVVKLYAPTPDRLP
ncbi:MAG: helix-turn-helix transcriptional regulator [Armatimonadota bacterium]